MASSGQETISVCQPKNFELVEQECAKLQQAIDQYGANASELFKKQKSELLASYKVFLDSTVKPDFRKLREEIDRKETQIATDERLKCCEQERDWFKKEALHLDKVVEKMLAEKKEMQSRIDDLEQDKRVMAKQVAVLSKQKNDIERHDEEKKEAEERSSTDADDSN